MTRTVLAVFTATTLSALTLVALADSQNQPTLDVKPIDHMTWSGHFDLVAEIRQRRADAKRAEAVRAEADGDNTPSIAYLRATRAIWDDDRLRDAPAIVEAGKDLLHIHAYRHDHQRRLDTSVEILAVIDANRERWLAMVETDFLHEQMTNRIDTDITTILSGMQGGGGVGRPEIELAALECLIPMARSEASRENLKVQREQLREQMAAGLYGPQGE